MKRTVEQKKDKQRLDLLVLERYPSLSRNQIQSLIMQGKVLVAGKPVTKPGTPIVSDAEIQLIQEQMKYVSRAGFKLEAALEAFKVDVKDLIAVDAGISTGGFTDCLLQNGIARVYGVDVGYGQVHDKVRTDKRVVLLEKTNVRYLESLPELVDIATLDLSFISLLKVMPAISKLIKPNGRIIALIKPQFEAEREEVSKGGVIKDEKIHQKVVEKIKQGMAEWGFVMKGVIESPITGATAGNKEFLALFERSL